MKTNMAQEYEILRSTFRYELAIRFSSRKQKKENVEIASNYRKPKNIWTTKIRNI